MRTAKRALSRAVAFVAVALAASLLAAAPTNAQTPPQPYNGTSIFVDEVDGVWQVVYQQFRIINDETGEVEWGGRDTAFLRDRDGNLMSTEDYPQKPGFTYDHRTGGERREIPVYAGDWTMVPITRCTDAGHPVLCSVPWEVDVHVVRHECSGPVAPESQRQPEGWVSIQCHSQRLAGVRAEVARLARVKAAAIRAEEQANRQRCAANRQHLRELNRNDDGRLPVATSGSCADVKERVINYSLLSGLWEHAKHGTLVSQFTNNGVVDKAGLRQEIDRIQREQEEHRSRSVCYLEGGKLRIIGSGETQESCEGKGGAWNSNPWGRTSPPPGN